MSTRSRLATWMRLLLLVAAIFAVFYGVVFGSYYLLHPWAVSLPGKPGLVGYWRGEVPFGPDDTRRIVLELEANPGTSIEGTAKVCGGPHRMSYDIDGEAGNRSGTSFWLNPSVWNYDPGVYLYRMNGEWDLADLVTIDATLATFTADDTDVPERPVSFTLHRSDSDEFDKTC